MSSTYVRTQVKDYLAANAPTETLIDLTAAFQEIKELVEDAGITSNDTWLGIEFVGDDEVPITIPATNDTGKYRESGSIFMHVVDIAKLGAGDALLQRGETLRNLFRGKRIGDIIVESVTPMNFNAGSTLQFDGGYMSGSIIVSYQRDLEL